MAPPASSRGPEALRRVTIAGWRCLASMRKPWRCAYSKIASRGLLAPGCAVETRRQATVSGPVHEIPHLAFDVTDTDHGKHPVSYSRTAQRKPSFVSDRSVSIAVSASESVRSRAFWAGRQGRDPQISCQRHWSERSRCVSEVVCGSLAPVGVRASSETESAGCPRFSSSLSPVSGHRGYVPSTRPPAAPLTARILRKSTRGSVSWFTRPTRSRHIAALMRATGI